MALPTITMQGIADLARVQRPVVSIWRRRFTDGPTQFPSPLDSTALIFDADEVARWLVQTSHGNNTDAEIEAHLYSTTFSHAQQHAAEVSALLLLSHVTGTLVQELDETTALAASYDHRLDLVLDDAEVSTALLDSSFCVTSDLLAEAAFSPQAALSELHEAALTGDSFWRPEALTGGAYQFLGSALASVAADVAEIRLSGPGSIPLGVALADQMGPDDNVSFGLPGSPTVLAPDLVARRLLATMAQTARDDVDGPILWLHVDTSAKDEEAFFDGVEDALLSVTQSDYLVVVGPAPFMMDDPHSTRRRGLLLPQPDQVEPLRYVAELPRALSRFHPRRRLALWAFGHPNCPWTVAADLATVQVDMASAQSLGGDLLASLSGVEAIRSRAFQRSEIRATDRLVRLDSLNLAASYQKAVSGGRRLARIWELDGRGWSDGLAASDGGRVASMSLAQAVEKGLLNDMPGNRLPAHLIGSLEPGGAPIVGPGEVQGTADRPRGIDRLELERTAPQAQFTLPGDVIYTQGTAPAALIDVEGGSVVQAPARVIRCRTNAEADMVLSPHVLVLDIPRQVSPNRGLWLLRTVSPGTATQIAAVAMPVDQRLGDLRRQLTDLEELRTEMLDGLGDGTLVADFINQNGSA